MPPPKKDSGAPAPEVRAQYEEFPYPARVPAEERQHLFVRILARMDSVSHHLYRGRQDFRDFRVLSAGGGTGDSAIFWAEELRDRGRSEIVYLDVSQASLRIARERAEMRRLENVRWVHASLLDLPDLGLGQFDFIDCTGVLHHLEDPDAGLRALVSVLKPGGAMNLMVYGLYGRMGVYQVQDLMRLVNLPEDGPQKRVENTRAVLQSLPPYHWVNVSKKLGFGLSDTANDAGIFDMFLHARDRAYTITQVHELLDRAGLQMMGEPGTEYSQTQYLPETFLKDPALLHRISEYPVRVQQAIGEAMSSRLSRHELYAARAGEGARAAEVSDTELIPWAGMDPVTPLDKLAIDAESQSEDFTITFHQLPGKPQLMVPAGQLTPHFLRLIDGRRSIAEVYAAVRAAVPGVTDAEMVRHFGRLFQSLNRGHALYLRHPENPAFPEVGEMQERVEGA